MQTEQLAVLRTVGLAPQPTIINNRLKNVPDEDLGFGAGANVTKPYYGFQWFIPDAA